MKKRLFIKGILSLSLVTFMGVGLANANNTKLTVNPPIESSELTILEANEAIAIEAMRVFHAVEMTYQQREGQGEFANVKELFLVGYIDGELANASGCPKLEQPTYKNFCPGDGQARHGYKYQLVFTRSENGKPATFAAVAFPIINTGDNRTGTRSFYVDNTGIIRYSDDPNVIANANSSPLPN
ncbi:MAG: hypothetical protein WAQ98_30815 [Blastocatellia bacterium]